MQTAEYEFDDLEEQAFSKCALWLTVVSLAMFVWSGLNVWAGISEMNVGSFVQAGVGILLAVLLWQARSSFTAVVDTQGNDISHALAAMSSLKIYFWIQAALLILAFLFVIGVFFFGMGAAMMR